MKRRKSLMIPAILFLGLIFISGCGDGVSEGTLNTTGATVTLTSDASGAAGLSAGQSCILEATLMDKSVTPSTTPGTPPTPAPQPLSHQEIFFSFVENESGGTLTHVNGGITDASGKAYAIYRAGSLKPGLSIRDTIKANIKDFSGLVIITRKGGGGPGAGFQVSVTATPTTVKEGGVSLITANVRNAEGELVSGQTVTFSFLTNNSGGSLTVLSAVTDAAGNATTQYQAGNSSPDKTLQDTIRAGITGSVGAVVVTREASTEAPISITVAAAPASLAAGQTSVVTATLTGAHNTGVTVNFVLETNNSGATLSRPSSVTDGTGKAVVTYTAGANNPNVDVEDTILAVVGNATSAVTITRTAAAASDYSITVTASPTTLPTAGGSSVITAIVKKGTAGVSGVTVNFVQSGGTSVLPAAATTDASGNAQSVFKGGGGAAGTEAGVVTASITISGNTYSSAVVIKY